MAEAKENRRKRRNEFDTALEDHASNRPKTVVTIEGELKRETGSRPKSESDLGEWLMDNEDTPVGRQLNDWDNEFVAADPDDGFKPKINKPKVQEAAKRFVVESQDFQYGRDYVVSLAKERAEQNGVTVKNDAEAEKLYNDYYATKADAILLSSEIGNVKLTEAQRRRLEAARDGKMLDTTYNERRKESGSLQNSIERNAPRLSGIELEKARENFREWVQSDDRNERAA